MHVCLCTAASENFGLKCMGLYVGASAIANDTSSTDSLTTPCNRRKRRSDRRTVLTEPSQKRRRLNQERQASQHLSDSDTDGTGDDNIRYLMAQVVSTSKSKDARIKDLEEAVERLEIHNARLEGQLSNAVRREKRAKSSRVCHLITSHLITSHRITSHLSTDATTGR